MDDTFLLTNMTPQEPTINRRSWKILEENIRANFNKNRMDTWILTLAVYKSPSKRIGSGIPVPTGYWKIVYSGSDSRYYYADNLPNAKVHKITFIDVNKLILSVPNF